MKCRSRSVLIVGALKEKLEDARFGGQAFACRSLSDGLSVRGWEVLELDSSLRSITHRAGVGRLGVAAKRFLSFVRACIARRPASTLVFSSYGLSFVEKGLMVVVARLLGVRGVLLPRSGHLRAQLDRSGLFRLYCRVVMRSASVVVCQSAIWKDYFSEMGVSEGKLAVIENWIPPSSLASPGETVSGSGKSGALIGYFSRIEHDKGVMDFLEALQLAHSGRNDVRGILYGDGSYVPAVRSWIEKHAAHDYVVYAGWLDPEQKQRSLRELDMLVFTSHAEGYPNAVLEAMALKVPVVSVRVGSTVDMLIHGESGLLVEVGDVSGLATSILRLAGDPEARCRMAEAAYCRVINVNDYDTSLSTIEAILQ